MNNVTNLPLTQKTNHLLKPRRIEMLEEMIDVLAIIYQCGTSVEDKKIPQDIGEKMTKCSLDFAKYGNKQECAALENFIQAMNNVQQMGVRPIELAYEILAPMALQHLRAELGVED